MNVLKPAAYGVGLLAAVALMAGCSSGSQPALARGSVTNAARLGAEPLHLRGGLDAFAAVHPYGPLHRDHHKSWIAPDAKRSPRLMFASDSEHGDVYVYSLPDMKLKGTLTGFYEPQGLCSDPRGSVYVANTLDTQVLKFARNGKLLHTYTDSYGYPIGCAFDPASGDLAVTNAFGFSGPGQVLIFPGTGLPKVLTNPSQYSYYFAGYGPGDNLWVSGRDSSGNFMLSQCNYSTCSTVNLTGGTVYFPGTVQWDKSSGNWVVFDQLCNDTAMTCSYPVSASGALETPTVYQNYQGGNVCDMVQGEIAANHGKYVVGGDYAYCNTLPKTNDRWTYAPTANPTAYVTLPSYSDPVGATVSSKCDYYC
ncbi:MAG: hypothetical protein WAL67_05945 [Candidatus Cybelea sp.]